MGLQKMMNISGWKCRQPLHSPMKNTRTCAFFTTTFLHSNNWCIWIQLAFMIGRNYIQFARGWMHKYKAALTRFTQSGTHGSNFFNFCNEKLTHITSPRIWSWGLIWMIWWKLTCLKNVLCLQICWEIPRVQSSVHLHPRGNDGRKRRTNGANKRLNLTNGSKLRSNFGLFVKIWRRAPTTISKPNLMIILKTFFSKRNVLFPS